jgi:predicted flap endonuclease-1-like 5' DNA nuclease
VEVSPVAVPAIAKAADEPVAEPVIVKDVVAPEAPQPEKVIEVPAPVATTKKNAQTTTPAPTSRSASRSASKSSPKSTSKPKSAAASEASRSDSVRHKDEPEQIARIEGEEAHAGKRPVGYVAPRSGKADDLKLIKGIAKTNEDKLHALGIWHFDQMANWTSDEITWVGSYLAFPGRIQREKWVEQARQFLKGEETEHAKAVKTGLDQSSKPRPQSKTSKATENKTDKKAPVAASAATPSPAKKSPEKPSSSSTTRPKKKT